MNVLRLFQLFYFLPFYRPQIINRLIKNIISRLVDNEHNCQLQLYIMWLITHLQILKQKKTEEMHEHHLFWLFNYEEWLIADWWIERLVSFSFFISYLYVDRIWLTSVHFCHILVLNSQLNRNDKAYIWQTPAGDVCSLFFQSFYLLLVLIHQRELSLRLITLGGESHFAVAAGYERFDWQAFDSSCWAGCKKASVGDWRWSLDNIRWPLRAAPTISLHGDTLLLLSCLDTFFFFLSLPLFYLLLSFPLGVWRVEFLWVGSLYLILK